MYDLFNSFDDSFGLCPHNETHSAFFYYVNTNVEDGYMKTEWLCGSKQLYEHEMKNIVEKTDGYATGKILSMK